MPTQYRSRPAATSNRWGFGKTAVVTLLLIVAVLLVGNAASHAPWPFTGGRTWRTAIVAERKGRSDLSFEVEEKMTDAEATELFLKSGMVLKRESEDADGKKEVVFYKRLGKPSDEEWTLYKSVVYRWEKAKLGEDFNLYSSESDLDSGRNAWEFCNFAEGDDNVGAFRDCGPKGKVEHRFFARSLKNERNALTRVSFMVQQ